MKSYLWEILGFETELTLEESKHHQMRVRAHHKSYQICNGCNKLGNNWDKIRDRGRRMDCYLNSNGVVVLYE